MTAPFISDLRSALKTACAGLVLVAALTQPIMVRAQESITLTAIPPRLGDTGEIKLQPGQKFQTSIRVSNNSDVEMDVETFAKDFIIGADGTSPLQVKESVDSRWSMASWLVVSPSRQTLGPKKTAIVNILIEVPEDARPGGHYAMILHQPAVGSGEPGESSTGVNQQVGTLLYAIVDGPIQEQAFVHDFAFKPNFVERGPIDFSFGIENQSDVHIRPATTIEIYNVFKRKVAELIVEPQNVFPGSQRAFSDTWNVAWGFGPYTAVLTSSYGSQGQTLSAETTVWILPITIIIAIVIILLAIVTGYIAVRRHLAHQKSSETTPVATSKEKAERADGTTPPPTI